MKTAIEITFFACGLVLLFSHERSPKLAKSASVLGLICGAFIIGRWLMNPYTPIFG